MLGLALLAACASTGRPLAEIASNANAGRDSGPTLIASGDVLDVRFGGKTDWNQAVKVRPDGSASFPGLAPLEVAGVSVASLEQQLEHSYADVLPKADVNINITTFGDRHVYVLGEVHDPGEFPIDGEITFLQALGRAGGALKETALLQNVMLVRWNPQDKRQFVWRIDARQRNWGEGAPLFLQNYDVIFVPNTPIDDVDIWVDQYIRRLIPFPYLFPAMPPAQ